MFSLNWKEPEITKSSNKKRKIENVENEENEENENVEHDENTVGNTSPYVRSEGNDIYFYAGIDKKTIIMLQRETTKVIKIITEKANNAEKVGCVVTYPPIKLHINSPGGYIYSAFAYIDFMKQTKIKNPKIVFHTIIEGGSASAATLISVTGDKRYITEYGQMLIHQLSGGNWGKFHELKDDMKNSTELMNKIKNIYIKHTKLSIKELNKILKHDLYWDAEKCLDVGLVDEIIV